MTRLGQDRGRAGHGRGRAARLVAAALGAVTATATALITAAGPAGAVVWSSPCSATVHVDSAWGGSQDWAGTVVTVTVTNSASTAATSWATTTRLADGQSVGSIWGAQPTVTGPTFVARNDPGNGALAPGAS